MVEKMHGPHQDYGPKWALPIIHFIDKLALYGIDVFHRPTVDPPIS